VLSLTEYFYGKPPNERMSQFVAADLEKPVCNIRMAETSIWSLPQHTSLSHLPVKEAGLLVLEGKTYGGHRRSDDRDILLVFSENEPAQSYNVAGDTDLR